MPDRSFVSRLRPLSIGGGVLANVLDSNIRSRFPNFLFQCSLATIALIVILLVENAVFRAAIVVAVASTAFTIFVVPDSVASSPRRVIGGHAVAVVTRSIFSSIFLIPALESASEQSGYITDIMAALSVGLGILAMVATNTEHPPAAGTALGLVIHGWSWSAVAFILSSAVILSILRIVLRPRMINLI